MDYDRDKVDEMTLALLRLTTFDEDQYGTRAWKGHDWDALDRLHAKGYISDPKSKAKWSSARRMRNAACRSMARSWALAWSR